MSQEGVIKVYEFTDSDLVYINNALYFYSTLWCSKTFYIIYLFEPNTHTREKPDSLRRNSSEDKRQKSSSHHSFFPPLHWFF